MQSSTVGGALSSALGSVQTTLSNATDGLSILVPILSRNLTKYKRRPDPGKAESTCPGSIDTPLISLLQSLGEPIKILPLDLRNKIKSHTAHDILLRPQGWNASRRGKTQGLFSTTQRGHRSGRYLFVPTRSFGSSSASRLSLQRLEDDADSTPYDADAQAAYYEALLRSGTNPSRIIDRFEGNKYASNAQCVAAYVEAMVQLRQSPRVIAERVSEFAGRSMEDSSRDVSSRYSRSSYERPYYNPDRESKAQRNGMRNGPAQDGNYGTKENPIYVISTPGSQFSWKRAVFQIVKGGIWFFLFFTGALVLLETQGLGRPGGKGALGGRFQSEIEPSNRDVVKFEDVAGVDDAKEELEEVVEFLKDPARFSRLGGKMPKGILLTGPPGTGKTLLARAIAGEAGVPFFFMSGSEFDEVYVGVGARRVRDLFQAARRKAPAIIFIDELDAIGGKRNPRDASYMRQTLNQLLVDLDGFSQSEGVIIIAATNFPRLLDTALVRPGRFDKHINVPLPDVRGRLQILKVHMRKIVTAPDLDPETLARSTPGLSGADLASLVNEAAVRASRLKEKRVTQKHFDWARDKLIMGSERKTAVITPESKKLTAYHEGGHALIAHLTEGATPLHKVTIIPRGNALGMTVQIPELDRDNYTRKEYYAMLDVSMGGRAAEELIFGSDNVTSGAMSDLSHATRVARLMITKLGMSEKVAGLQFYSDSDLRNLTGPSRQVIDGEIKRILEESYARVLHVLKQNQAELHKIADALLEMETLEKEELTKVLPAKNGKKR